MAVQREIVPGRFVIFMVAAVVVLIASAASGVMGLSLVLIPALFFVVGAILQAYGAAVHDEAIRPPRRGPTPFALAPELWLLSALEGYRRDVSTNGEASKETSHVTGPGEPPGEG